MEEKKLIPAPIDNKNLMEDPFEDEVFGDFYAAENHRKNGKRHLFGSIDIDTDEFNASGYVEVSWNYGGHCVCIEFKAAPANEDFESMRKDAYSYYRKLFKEWECPDNEDLVVKFSENGHKLYVSFYFDVD